MKKLTVLFLFMSVFGYAQIDYKGLVRNLEEINRTTDLKFYFKGLPIETEGNVIAFNDERFLRYFGIVIKKVKFDQHWTGKRMEITPFDEKEDFFKIKSKLIERHGEPEVDDNGSTIDYVWNDSKEEIRLSITMEWEEDDEERNSNENSGEGQFKAFDELTITFKER